MFTGSIYFELSPYGYVVSSFYDNPWLFRNELTDWWHHGSRKVMRIEGTFNFIPKRGQFCKRPHKLIQWRSV